MSIAQQAKYREQFVALFERRQSVLREAVTSDTINIGGTEYFLTAGSAAGGTGGASAVTRGSDGLIPAQDDSQTQTPVVLTEAHYLNRKTGFDIFRAQGNQLEIMRTNGLAVINRQMDSVILNALNTGTVTLGAVASMSKAVANQIATKLNNANAGDEDNMLYAAVSPAAWAELTDITSFANSLYAATGGKLENGIPKTVNWVHWMGINWKKHTGLTGVGTGSCTCVAWHKAAIGHAIGPGTINAVIARNEEQDYSYARHSVYHGGAVLQNAGIVKFAHNDSPLS